MCMCIYMYLQLEDAYEVLSGRLQHLTALERGEVRETERDGGGGEGGGRGGGGEGGGALLGGLTRKRSHSLSRELLSVHPRLWVRG